MNELSYDEIQTPISVWQHLLDLNPISFDDYFFEPFAGRKNIYNLIQNVLRINE